MGFPFTHIILAWAPAKLYEKLSKNKLTSTYWALLFFGTLFPDSEVFVDWIFGTAIHHTITHGLLAPLVTLILITLIYGLLTKNYRKGLHYGSIFAIGMLIHIIIDLFGPGVPLLYPNMLHFSLIDGIQTPATANITLFQKSQQEMVHVYKSLLLDTGLGLLWLSYLFSRKKVQTF